MSSTNFLELKHQTDNEIKRLGWSKDKCIAYIQKHYGKRSRRVMTDAELQHLLARLKAKQPQEPTQSLFTPKARSKRRKHILKS